MQNRRFRLLLIWNTVLTVLFLASLGANAVFVRAAGDPPVRVFSMHSDDSDIGGGSKHNPIDSTKNAPVISVPLNLSSEHKHFCVAVASVTVKQPAQPGRYRLAIGWENGTYLFSSIRDLQFVARDATNRDQTQEITTTFVREMAPGNHTLSLVGSKKTADMPALTLSSASMFAICMDQNPI